MFWVRFREFFDLSFRDVGRFNGATWELWRHEIMICLPYRYWSFD
jgi:hypothetical protein